jgi:hypothetical protein
MRLDSVICRFDLSTSRWQKIQIPYSWPEMDVETGILRIHSEQNGECILTSHDDWAWAECLLPDVAPELRVMPSGGTAAVQFLDPVSRQPFTVWADDVQVQYEACNHPTLIDPETGYGAMLFALPLAIFERDARGTVIHHRVRGRTAQA